MSNQFLEVKPIKLQEVQNVRIRMVFQFAQKDLFMIGIKSSVEARIFENQMLVRNSLVRNQEKSKTFVVDMLGLPNNTYERALRHNRLHIFAANLDGKTRIAAQDFFFAIDSCPHETFEIVHKGAVESFGIRILS